mmetsp:Transcript_5887/g.13635  ORF Transcript_5887/g.13635 Transcript_5887/m.13635 type:complete len:218 (-) Transcript_5887:454-1107(-)
MVLMAVTSSARCMRRKMPSVWTLASLGCALRASRMNGISDGLGLVRELRSPSASSLNDSSVASPSSVDRRAPSAAPGSAGRDEPSSSLALRAFASALALAMVLRCFSCLSANLSALRIILICASRACSSFFISRMTPLRLPDSTSMVLFCASTTSASMMSFCFDDSVSDVSPSSSRVLWCDFRSLSNSFLSPRLSCSYLPRRSSSMRLYSLFRLTLS